MISAIVCKVYNWDDDPQVFAGDCEGAELVTDPWTDLARQHGPKAVMSLSIDEATLAAETAREAAIIFPMIREHLDETPTCGIDYGCGAGRFTPYLADLCAFGAVGYDPCSELLAHAPEPPENVSWRSCPPPVLFATHREKFDLVFTAMVLGDPNMDFFATAEGLIQIMKPGATLAVLDHMPDAPPEGRWWRYRNKQFYIQAFATFGIELRHVGSLMQLENGVDVLIGRKV
jgi:trans-aconitate methyltransferase